MWISFFHQWHVNKTLEWKFPTKKIIFPSKRNILEKFKFYSFCHCFHRKTRHPKSLTKSSFQTKLKVFAHWGKKINKHNFWFQPKTTNNRGSFLIKNQKFLLIFFCFSAKTAEQHFLANSVQITSLLVLTTSLGLCCSISSSSLFSFLYLNASIGTEASLNDDICSSLIQNMI